MGSTTAALVTLLYVYICVCVCLYMCTGFVGFKALKEVAVSNLENGGAG